jgi:hypothetical protein
MSVQRDCACYLGIPDWLAGSSRTNSFFRVCVPHKMRQIRWLYYMLQRSSTRVKRWSSLLHVLHAAEMPISLQTEWIKFSFRIVLFTRHEMQTWTHILWAVNDTKLEPSRIVQALNFWYLFEFCQVRILARTPITVNDIFRNFLISSRKILG